MRQATLANQHRLKLTPYGEDVKARSLRVIADLRAGWATELGEERMLALEADLRKVTPREVRLDIPGWFNG